MLGGCAGVGVIVLPTSAGALLLASVFVWITESGNSTDGRSGLSVLWLLDPEPATLFLFTEGLV
jgi:hypothetical protein